MTASSLLIPKSSCEVKNAFGRSESRKRLFPGDGLPDQQNCVQASRENILNTYRQTTTNQVTMAEGAFLPFPEVNPSPARE